MNENVLNWKFTFFPKGNFIKSFSMHTCSQHAHQSTHTHWTGLGEKTVIWFSLFLLRRVKFSKQLFRLRKESHGSLSFTYPQWAFLLLSCHTYPWTHSRNFMEYYFAHALHVAILQILYSLTHTWIHTCHAHIQGRKNSCECECDEGYIVRMPGSRGGRRRVRNNVAFWGKGGILVSRILYETDK